MPLKLNKKIIIPAVLIGGGVALYFLNKSGKLDKLKNLIKGKEKEVEEEAPEKPVINNQTNIVTSNPLGSAADVKKFQEYYNSVKPAELPALDYTGWGPLTAAAYNSYKDKYAAAAAAGKLPAPGTTPKPPTTKVELADLLATNPNAANNKMLYAGVTGIGIYNLNNVITDKTKANILLGGILSVIKTSNISYKIIFVKGTGIKYYINYYTQSPDHFYVKI